MRVRIHLCLSVAVSVCLWRSVSLSPLVCVSCVERRFIDARLRKANEPQQKQTQLVIRLRKHRVSTTDTMSLLRKNTTTHTSNETTSTEFDRWRPSEGEVFREVCHAWGDDGPKNLSA